MNVDPDVRSQSVNSLVPELVVLRYQVMNIAPDIRKDQQRNLHSKSGQSDPITQTMKLKEAWSQPKLSVTFDDKVIVSHPTPEDLQINKEVD